MPRIDPCQLLKCLNVLLSNSGGIKSKDEVNRMANLMTKFSKKLVSKCIYILILKATEVDIMDMFMSAGGWDLVFSWLSDGIAAKNWPLVEELVELLLICPVTIERLKGNNCPKVIKLLSKDNTATEKVKQAACCVVEQWLSIVREATGRPIYEQQTDVVETGKEGELEEQIDVKEESETVVKGEDQLPIYKITIRDGQQVLAQVISDKSGPRVDTGTTDEGETEEGPNDDDEEVIATAKTKKKQVTVLSSSPSDSEEDPDDEDWAASKTNKPAKAGKKRSAAMSAQKKSLSATKRRKGAKGTEVEKPASATPKKTATKGKQLLLEENLEEHKTDDTKMVKIDSKPKDEKKSKDTKVKEEVKEKDKKQADKDRATLAKLVTPSISSMGRIPKKSKEGSGGTTKEEKKDKKEEKKPDKKPVEPPKPIPKDPKKYNYTTSTEIRKRESIVERPKTVVKTFNSKFRSTGLEEAAPLPKVVGKNKKEEKRVPKRLSPPLKEDISSPVPEKKFKEDEKDKKVTTPPKPKTMLLQESDMFGDALTAANTFKDITKKKKRRTSLTEVKKEKEGSPPKSEEKEKKPHEPAKPKFKFYHDTMEDIKTEEEDDKKDINVKGDGSVSPVTAKEIEDELEKTEEAISNYVKSEEKKNMEREKCRLASGILVYVKKRRVAKKSVTWGEGDAIQDIRYFELDETERVNVTKTFLDMKAMERTNEREQIMLSRKIAANDLMEEKTRWRPLIPVEVFGEYIEHGKNSLEKEIQHTRERTVAPTLYFNKKMIPDSPAEPDLEIHAQTEPILIPLTDTTGNPDSLISYKDKGWPDPKESPPPVENIPNGGVMEPMVEPIMMDRPPMMVGPPMMDFRPGQPMGPGFFPGVPGPPGILPAPGPPMGNWMGGGQPGEMMPPMNQEMMGMNPMMGMGMGPPNEMQQFQGMPPNMNHPGFMPRQPQMNFSPQHQFPPQEPRPSRPWYRPNAPHQPPGGGQWRHPSKGGNTNWAGKKTRTCLNIIKRGFCKTPHCAFKHPPPYSNHH